MNYESFTAKDLEQFKARGITPEQVERQLELFRRGFPYADIRRPATAGDGILTLSNAEKSALEKFFEAHRDDYRITKFVPASGAASRMFKTLFAYHEAWERQGRKTSIPEPAGDVKAFLEGLRHFAFYGLLDRHCREQYGMGGMEMVNAGRYGEIIATLLFTPGLNYGSLPKGLILFHHYPEGNRTAFEEHLVEGALYTAGRNGDVHLHFTVSPAHLEAFSTRFEEGRAFYEEKYGVQYDVRYSEQKPSTDTVAVTPDNRPFRKEDGTILFRPAGHGALIENLNDLVADVLFIKNIDNVVPDRLKESTVLHKKVLGGVLLQYRQRIDGWLERMDEGVLTEKELAELADFAGRELMISLPESFGVAAADGKQKMLYDLLHRPLRVCGMVRNEGEPGGGPFWVADSTGNLSLQIVESAQIDMDDPEKRKIVEGATHFNPVDLVCSVTDHRRRKFDLRKYVDPETFFISHKSYDGRELKALELPGLWNGGMARWITLFVEVPADTFHPVKTVNDLLRPEHAGS